MTLEGLIYKADRTTYTGSFRLRLNTAPEDGEAGITTGTRITVACDGAAPDPVGEYSVTLRAGTYDVEIPGSPAFQITAPTGSSTYALEQLTDASIGAVTTQIFQEWDDVPLVTLSTWVQAVYVREDLDGQKATFWRAGGVVAGVEGVDFVKDLANVYFERGA